jgi:O-antigen ligase
VTSPVTLAPVAKDVVPQQSSPSRLDSILFYGTFGLLLFGPLAFGAVEPWSIFIMQAGAASLFALWALTQVASGELHIASNPLFPPMLAFAALVLLQFATGRTAYRSATFSSALLYCTYGMFCFLAVQSLRRTRQIKTLAAAFTGYGIALALLALFQSIASNGKLYWLRTPRFGGWIYGPYVNHNHYAGLMEMLVPIPLVISFSRQVRGPRKAIAALAAAVMASTIFLSGSRGGMLAFAVQMAVLTAVLIRRRQTATTALLIGAFLAIAFGLLAWLGGGELAERIASVQSAARTELSGGMRLSIDRDALRMFTHKPVLGWGLSTFPEVYPQFRSFYTNLSVDAAHNDYLQLLVEMGGLGFVAMLWFLLLLYRCSIRKLKVGPHEINSSLSLAALLGVTGVLVHSFVDFNLQIPANAALFYVLCVIAAMEPRFGLHHSKHRKLKVLQGTSAEP